MNSDSNNNHRQDRKDRLHAKAYPNDEPGMQLPDPNHQAGEYSYQADHQGRTIAAEGWLKLGGGQSPRTAAQEGFDRGHLIGKQFGGQGDEQNITPMNPRVNRSYIRSFEDNLADRTRNGEQIFMRVRADYQGDDPRPARLNYDVYSKQGDQVKYEGTYTIAPDREMSVTLSKATNKQGRFWTNMESPDASITIH